MKSLSPALRLLPPWWRIRVYPRIAGDPCTQGGFGGRIIRRSVAPHNFEMLLELDDWMERLAAFLGIYYEIEASETLRHLLAPGDTFIDVGANVGFLTLTASHLVGSTGKVVAVEPNGSLLERIRKTLALNQIHNVELLQCAFGESEAMATLSFCEGHHGTASLQSSMHGGEQVCVKPGDSIMQMVPKSGRCLVKIDVEGYEQRVLQGMPGFISRLGTGFLVEITDKWLRSGGGGADELFDMMTAQGYTVYRPMVSARSKFSLVPLERHVSSLYQYDAVFLRKNDDWSCGPLGPAALKFL